MEILKLARRDIRAHLGRLILTGIAIVAGVGFVAGSFILADSLTETFTGLFEEASADVDAQVRPVEPEFGTESRSMPESVVATVAVVPEVGSYTPSVFVDNEQNYTPFSAVDENGDEVKPNGPPIVSFSWDGSDNEVFDEIEGSPPQGIDQIAISRDFADALDAAVGETHEFLALDGPRDFTISTIIDFKLTGGAWFALFDFESAQILFDKQGQVDAIDLTAAPGVTGEELVAAVAAVAPDDTEVLNQADVIADSTAEFEQIISILRNALLGFAGVALFVSLFIIYNTFAILVNQRMQQIGMLRALGATSGQIRLSVVFEAVIIGLIGSIIGLGFGYVVSEGIKAIFNAVGGFPETTTVIAPRTVIVAFVVGLGATVVSALGPAFRAAKVTPIAAMRNEAPAHSSVTRRIIIGGLVTVAGLVLLALGLFGHGQGTSTLLTELAVGAILTFIGVSLLTVLFAGPAVSFLGQSRTLGGAMLALGVALPALVFTIGEGLPDSPFSGFMFALKMFVAVMAVTIGASILVSALRGGPPVGLGGSAAALEGRLARQNAARSPQRTAATATALTIGVALISMVGVVGESLKGSFTDTLDRSINADLFVFDSQTGAPFSEDLADRLQTVDGVAQVSRFRVNEAKIDDDVVTLAAFDADTGTSIIDYDVTEGSLEGLTDGGILVFRDDATDRGIDVGEALTVTFPDLSTDELTVTGIYDDASVLGNSWIVDMSTYRAHIDDSSDDFVGATIADGADADAVKAAATVVTDQFPGVTAQDNEEFRATQEDQVDGIITLINSLLGFALFVAFLGVINTIALSVVERTREIGLLRAVGMTRRQLKSSIRWEAVMVCLFGAVVGIVLGSLFAWAAVAAIPDSIIASVAVPYETIIFALLIAALAGVIAAALPARRAAKLDVLSAISTE